MKEEEKRTKRLRDELGLSGDFEARWRKMLEDVNAHDDSQLSLEVQSHYEETIKTLQETVSVERLQCYLYCFLLSVQ